MLYPFTEIANFNQYEGKSSQRKRSCLSYIHSPTRGPDNGQCVGVDCLFRTRRLAMPREDKQNIVLRFFMYLYLVNSMTEAANMSIHVTAHRS